MEKLVLQTQVAKVTTTDSEGELFDTTPHSEGLQRLYPYLRQDRHSQLLFRPIKLNHHVRRLF
jgi:hypothetical protein